jgi:hypothetical protein
MSPPGARWVASLFAFLAAFPSQAQFSAPEAGSVRSVSGQFLVRGPEIVGPTFASLTLATNREYVLLDPTRLTVSCERIKQGLLRDLAAAPARKGMIYLQLYSGAAQAVTVNSAQFSDAWQFQVELPELVQRHLYVRAIVQALLLEIANRSADSRGAEIPDWLCEGFAQRLLASGEVTLIPPAPKPTPNGPSLQATVFNTRRADPLSAARDQLRRHPISFDELSWPSEETLAGDSGVSYRRATQFLIHELLAFPDGPACLRAMLASLPHRQNWQFAFLDGFRAHFQSPLDIEKWWALHLTHFIGRDLAQTWPLRESWDKLDDALHTPVQIRSSTNDLPMHSEISLQNLLREWDDPARQQALQAKANELQLLRLRVAPDLAPLVSHYIETLNAYVEAARKIRSSHFPLLRQTRLRNLNAEVLNRLDELDAERRAECPAPAKVRLSFEVSPASNALEEGKSPAR